MVVYNSNGAKSSYQVCTGEIHRRVMEILCAGSCRGNVRGMRVGKGVGNLFPTLSLLCLFLFLSFPSLSQRARASASEQHVDATANPWIRLAVTGVTDTCSSDRLAASLPLPPAVPGLLLPIGAKRGNVLDSGNVTLALRLAKYHGGLPRTTARRVSYLSRGTFGQISFHPRDY